MLSRHAARSACRALAARARALHATAPAWDVGIGNIGIRHEPIAPVLGKVPKVGTAAEAVQCIRSGDSVFVQGQAATPTLLTRAMAEHGRSGHLEDVSVYHLFTMGECPYVDPSLEGTFRVKSFFLGGNVREATEAGRADYLPIFLSEIPKTFHRREIPLDVALVQVSPPDQHGYCSLGTSVDCTRAALQMARIVVGQINKHVPRTHGDGIIHYTNLDHVVHHDAPLYHPIFDPPGVPETAIGGLVAQHLVQDGATLQLGIGHLPAGVLAHLGGHRNLGDHTEMLGDEMLPLVDSGVVNNSMKRLDRGKMVATFLMGSQALYDYADDNPTLDMRDVAYTNDPHVIRMQPSMTAINSATEVDFTGQVVADSVGTKIYSGVGGQVDFTRGAALAENGRPVVVVPSRTRSGRARIVASIQEGSGVVTTRAHTHYVVTEYGIAQLYGKSLGERVEAMIAIAHPDDRDDLTAQAHARGLLTVKRFIPRFDCPPPPPLPQSRQ